MPCAIDAYLYSFSEVSFYNNTLEAVKRGRAVLVAAKVPYKRPEDFLCEMVKTDAHMDKVSKQASKLAL